MKKEDCGCKKGKSKKGVNVRMSGEESLEHLKPLYTKEEIEDAVYMLDTTRKFNTEQMKYIFDLYNKIYDKKETNLGCPSCQRTVSRGLRYKLDELNGKRKTKR